MATIVLDFNDVSIVSQSPEDRSKAELRWVSFEHYLLSKGYRLRARYRPNWIPSWTVTGARPDICEDSVDSMPLRVLDATRIHDERQVMLKMLVSLPNDREGDEELDLLQRFSSSPLQFHPSNHVVPCLDFFPIPGVDNGNFVVMPLLSHYDYPPFYNLEELYDFLQQVFEGITFMHLNDVAHCDIASANIMMDARPLYDENFHPVLQHLALNGQRLINPRYLRCQKHVHYYIIDLGYAKWFRDLDSPRMVSGKRARQRAPEQKKGHPYNPFPADVYQLGAMLRRDLIPKYKDLGFLLPLARKMTEPDPQQRPDMKAASLAMTTVFAGLSGWKRRWPIMPPGIRFNDRCVLTVTALASELLLIVRRILSFLSRWHH